MKLKIFISGSVILFFSVFILLFFMFTEKEVFPQKPAEKEKTSIINEKILTEKEKPLVKEASAFVKNSSSLENKNMDFIKDLKIDLVSFFHDVEKKFGNVRNSGEHLEEVYSYFLKKFGIKNGESLFEVYSVFLTCSENLAMKMESLPMVYSKDLILERIDFVKEFRKDYLGEELYSVIFGNSSDLRKFSIEKRAVLSDKNLYSYEKLEYLKALSEKYENLEKDVNKNSYKEYRDALKIYEKDISELSQADLEIQIDELKKEFFTESALEKRKALEKKDKAYEKKAVFYERGVKTILLENDLSEKEKKEKIEELGSSIFSKTEKDRYKRNKTLKKERARLLKKYGIN